MALHLGGCVMGPREVISMGYDLSHSSAMPPLPLFGRLSAAAARLASHSAQGPLVNELKSHRLEASYHLRNLAMPV